MIVMPANARGALVHYLAGRHGHLGHLYSPGAQSTPRPWLPYALDNGAYAAWDNGRRWDSNAFLDLLLWATRQRQAPLWVLVPDAVGDRGETLARWAEWSPIVRRYGWPLAFAAQDGMEPGDVPTDAAVVFIGGTDGWKRAAIAPWCRAFPRVHVGRINSPDWLSYCERAGAESVDGTGWFQGDAKQVGGLLRWLEDAGTGRKPTPLTPAELVRSWRATPPDGQTSLEFAPTDGPTAHASRSSSPVAPAPCGAASYPSRTSDPNP